MCGETQPEYREITLLSGQTRDGSGLWTVSRTEDGSVELTKEVTSTPVGAFLVSSSSRRHLFGAERDRVNNRREFDSPRRSDVRMSN